MQQSWNSSAQTQPSTESQSQKCQGLSSSCCDALEKLRTKKETPAIYRIRCALRIADFLLPESRVSCGAEAGGRFRGEDALLVPGCGISFSNIRQS